VSSKTGFLPELDPLHTLPTKYSKLDEILNEMTWTKADGTNGMLFTNSLCETVNRDLPLYEVSTEEDSRV
jgi:hypothetical protein